MPREIPLYTTEGVPDARVTEHRFVTDDMLSLGLMRFWKADCDDVVVIIHGLTTSSDMFIMPEHRNLVTWLHDQGFTDVRSEEHTSELQSLMRISYAVFCLKNKKKSQNN